MIFFLVTSIEDIFRPTSTSRTSTSTHWSMSSTTRSTSQSTTRSTSPWTWPSTSTQESSPSTTRSTISWTWPSLSTGESSSSFSSSTTQRPPLGLTTWSFDFVDYQIGDEVIYDGVKYRCVAPHRSYPGAEPGILTWAWWQPIEEEEENSAE